MSANEPVPPAPSPAVSPAAEPAAPPAAPAESPAAAPAKPSSAKPGGFIEWVWRGKSLKAARGFVKELPLVEQQRLQRARVALELADRAYDPVDVLKAGSSLGLSISLYREAAYWGLLAQSEAYAGPDLKSVFETVPSDLLEFAAGGHEGSRQVKQALVERSFVETAALPAEELPRDAALAHDFAHALVRHKLAPTARVGQLLLQRGVRFVGMLSLVIAVVVGAVLGIERLTLKPDLAFGRPWRASSALDICKPKEHFCAAARTDIFFCTLEEKDPWVEIDLGKPMQVGRVEVVNRSDCCPDRAVPLVVEVSVDQKNWREVSRRQDTFSTWKTNFTPQNARYVRLRATRRTILHLEKVAVRSG